MEIYKNINKNYKVSDKVNIFSIRNGIILKPSKSNGYHKITLRINGVKKKYGIHQLVAMAFLGHKPDGHKIVVDHINSNKSDNRLENLRLTTNRENLSRRGGSSKYVGVSKFRNKWMSTITINNKLEYLGIYKTEEEAHRSHVKRLNELYPLY